MKSASAPRRASKRSRRWRPSLQRAIVLPFASLALFAGVTGWLEFRTSQMVARNLANRLSQDASKQVADRVRNFVNIPEIFLELEAISIREGQVNLKDFDRLQTHFWQQIEISPSVDTMYYGSANGDFLLVKQGDRDLVYLRDATTGGKRDIYTLDETGTRGELVTRGEYDPRTRPWFKAAVAAREFAWSPIYTFAAFPDLGITSALPVYAESGELEGVLGIDITLNQLSDILQELNIGSNGHAFIVDESGVLVASSKPAPLLEEGDETRQSKVLAADSQIPAVQSVARYLRATQKDWAQTEHLKLIEASLDGQNHFIQISKLHDGLGLNWRLVVAIPTSDFTGAVFRVVAIAVLMGAGSVGLTVAMFFFTSRRVVRPLQQLSHAASTVESGGFEQVDVDAFEVAEVYQLASAFQRMTERQRQAFGTLQQFNTDLEARVRDRTSALERAKRDAEAANRTKSDFLAVMSHELRTPMNAIIGMTGLLLDTSLDYDQKDFTKTIRNSGEALLTLIGEILDFSKIESGKMELENQRFDLASCLEDTLDLLAPIAAEKDLEMTSWIEPDVPREVMGDPTRLRQILANLVGNAVKFTESGEVEVLLRRSPMEDGCDAPFSPRSDDCDDDISEVSASSSIELEWVVRDTGIGIPSDRLTRLFQPFSQADTSVTRRYGGTGLGLAISQRLCEMMGGSIDVSSQVGFGSTFSFTVAVEAIPENSSPPSAEVLPLVGQRVLLLYANDAVRQNLSRYLMQAGASEVVRARSPQQALNALELDNDFQFAIIDVMTDNLKFSKTIAYLNTLDNLKLLAFGNAKHSERLRSLQFSGASAFAFKPIKPSQFFELLDRLDRPQSNQSNAFGGLLTPNVTAEVSAHPMRLLVVDDVPVNQKVALRMLDRLGYRADVASDGREALHLLQQHTYDVVLMDVQMPEMDGLEVTRRLRKLTRDADFPWIIAMTAHAMTGDRDRCLEAGMNDYVPKPVRMEALDRALQQAAQTLHVAARSGSIPSTNMPVRETSGAAPQAPAPQTLASEATNSSNSAIDRSVLDDFQLVTGDDSGEFLATTISVFLRDAPAKLNAIRSAIGNDDAEALRKAAHAFKSPSATLGALHLSRLCLELELLGKSGTLAEVSEFMHRLQVEYNRAVAMLERISEELAAGLEGGASCHS